MNSSLHVSHCGTLPSPGRSVIGKYSHGSQLVRGCSATYNDSIRRWASRYWGWSLKWFGGRVLRSPCGYGALCFLGRQLSTNDQTASRAAGGPKLLWRFAGGCSARILCLRYLRTEGRWSAMRLDVVYPYVSALPLTESQSISRSRLEDSTHSYNFPFARFLSHKRKKGAHRLEAHCEVKQKDPLFPVDLR